MRVGLCGEIGYDIPSSEEVGALHCLDKEYRFAAYSLN